MNKQIPNLIKRLLWSFFLAIRHYFGEETHRLSVASLSALPYAPETTTDPAYKKTSSAPEITTYK